MNLWKITRNQFLRNVTFSGSGVSMSAAFVRYRETTKHWELTESDYVGDKSLSNVVRSDFFLYGRNAG